MLAQPLSRCKTCSQAFRNAARFFVDMSMGAPEDKATDIDLCKTFSENMLPLMCERVEGQSDDDVAFKWPAGPCYRGDEMLLPQLPKPNVGPDIHSATRRPHSPP